MVLSLVYEADDAEFIDSAIKVLAELGWQGTFFANPATVLESIGEWRALADAGHEIGNGALSGVTLSGELVNWTVRMIEQDLHMTQTFLEDTFGCRAVSAFSYPGSRSICADGDYREMVDAMFEITLSPVPAPPEGPGRATSRFLFTWDDDAEWVVTSAPDPKSEAMDELVYEVKTKGIEVVPVHAAARRLGRLNSIG